MGLEVTRIVPELPFLYVITETKLIATPIRHHTGNTMYEYFETPCMSTQVNYCRGEILHAYGDIAGHCGHFGAKSDWLNL